MLPAPDLIMEFVETHGAMTESSPTQGEVDLSLLEDSLRLTPWQRLLENERALALVPMLETALADLHPVHRQTPQRLPFSVAADYPRGLKIMYLSTDWVVLDCVGEIKGVGDFAAVVRRSLLVELPIGACRILDVEALIDSKSVLDRPQDKPALIHLKHIQQRTKSGNS
jgi:hypothetical protein